MITTTYNYSSGTGFLYDDTKIGFSETSADLLLQNIPETFTQNYASGAGFTYNSSYTEFVGGVMRQKNLAPANLLCYAAWDSFLNVNYGTGGLAVTPFNSASVSGSVLNLTGSTNKYVQLPSSYVVGNQATIAFVYKPNYSGAPSANQIMYGNSGSANYFALLHAGGSGNFYLSVSDQSGTFIISAYNFGVWSPVSGTSYTIVFQLDLVNGATKLFINGSQFGSTNNVTGVRTTSTGAWVGSDGVPSDGNPNFSISSLAIYSSVLGPTSITPLPDTNFTADVITLPVFTYNFVSNLVGFTSATVTDTNGPTYALNSKWWNGSMWTTSNLTPAQSNTAAQIVANIASLPAANTVTVTAFTASLAQTQQSFSLLNLNYTALIYPQTDPTIAPNVPLTMDALSAFTAVLSASGSDAVKFFLQISGANYWWNGAAWAASNGSLAQSNVASDINTNVAALSSLISLGAYVTPYAILHSASGFTTPTLTSSSLTYDYFGPEPTPPMVCTVFGYIVDESETPVVGAIVTVQNPQTFINQGIIVAQGQERATTDSQGYFHLNLVETASLTGVYYNFSVVYPYTTSQNIGTPPNTYNFGKAQVPNTPSANLASFTFS